MALCYYMLINIKLGQGVYDDEEDCSSVFGDGIEQCALCWELFRG